MSAAVEYVATVECEDGRYLMTYVEFDDGQAMGYCFDGTGMAATEVQACEDAIAFLCMVGALLAGSAPPGG